MWNLVPFLSRKAYDFSAMSGSVTVDTVLVRALDVVDMRLGQLLVRVHAINVLSPGQLSLLAFSTSPSPDSPEADFVATISTAFAPLETASTGALVRVGLIAGFGSHLRLVLRAVVASGAQTHRATLSAALALRARP
jgi:hypothetical protein